MSTTALHTTVRTETAQPAAAIAADWKAGLPVLRCDGFSLRELRLSDAHSLLALLTAEEVTRFISPPPSTLEGF